MSVARFIQGFAAYALNRQHRQMQLIERVEHTRQRGLIGELS